jgi:hypothetical protein
MKSPARCAAWLLPFLLTGCFHKSQEAQNQPLAPPLKPSPTLELASVELPPKLLVIPGKPIYDMPVQAQPIKPTAKHKKQANLTPEDTASAADAVASPAPSASPAPAVSALGELSSGGPANLRQQTEDSIAAIERGLNGVNGPLSDSDQTTANHIQEFLKQAKAALASGDVEGAHTLAAKAQVLLTELIR